MNIEETKKIADKAEGWLTDEEGKTLYNLAKSCKGKGVIVEIGSWKGKSTICLGNGSKEGDKIKIFAIDPHTGSSEQQKMFGKVDTFEEFKKNIKNAKVGDIILPLVKTSEEAANNFDKPVEFGFIDGAHEYNFVKLDFDLWFPKVMNGGVLAFHDSWHFIGSNLATAIPLLFSSKIKNPRLVDTITYFEKVEKNSSFDRFRNICFFIYCTLFGINGALRLKYQSGKVI
ncbi:MAG: class I SAM-dependent methyltransferase [Methanosarcinales archaeon Met12]|nr:MAG: class I SAM-dependent methyltransferase [Methanosarcinales archaeon Met12]